MGNLGRPGYGATTDGTWPYSYVIIAPSLPTTFSTAVIVIVFVLPFQI